MERIYCICKGTGSTNSTGHALEKENFDADVPCQESTSFTLGEDDRTE